MILNADKGNVTDSPDLKFSAIDIVNHPQWKHC